MEKVVNKLIQQLSFLADVESVGCSGDIGNLSPGSDIDLFVFCSAIPRQTVRLQLLPNDSFVEAVSDAWGTGHHGAVNDTDLSIMFFTTAFTEADIEKTLQGSQIQRTHNGYYYPIGRCYTIANMQILYDANLFLHHLQKRLSAYPEDLSNKLTVYHLNKANDTEDFNRAVLRRDLLFYHSTLDIAIDHLLQALFAANRTYFPSRKRSFEFIESFQFKPDNCMERMIEIIRLGSAAETLGDSHLLWCDLHSDAQSILASGFA